MRVEEYLKKHFKMDITQKQDLCNTNLAGCSY